jgi:hypothetical protein
MSYKLILEESFDTSYDIEINESTGEKHYIIRGVVSTPNKKNKNGRVYPKQIWEKEVDRYINEDIKNNTYNTLAEWEHPPRSTVDPMKAVAKCRKVWWENDEVMGEFVILNNNSPETNQIKALIEQGLPIGVSTRGTGRLGKGNIVEEYRWITTDLVSNPSNHASYLRGLTESGFTKDLILEDKEFEITEDGIVCKDGVCKMHENSEKTSCEDKAKKLVEAFETIANKKEILEKQQKENEIMKKFKEIFENKENKENKIDEAVTGKISAMVTIKRILDRGNIKGRDAGELRDVLEFLSKEFKIPLD